MFAVLQNNQFKSVFTREDLERIPEMPVSSFPSINNIDICPNGVFKLLSELNPYKSPSPDAIYLWTCSKHVAIEVTPMLTHLFQQS